MQAVSPQEVTQSVEIDIEQFKHYASGNVVPLDTSLANGWYLVTVEGNGIGFAKITGKVLKN